jgi:prevent-host-death family protein
VRTINFSEFKTQCHALIRAVHDTGEPIRITCHGKPIVEIHPIAIDAAEKERLRAERDAHDIELINRFADELNANALDVLEYQADMFAKPRRGKAKMKSRSRQR